MRRSLNPFFLAGIGAGVAAAGIATARALRNSPPPNGAVVVVTGGSRGLGFSIASRFAQRPVRLVLAARNLAELNAAQSSLLAQHPHLHPDDFYLVSADLTKREDCERLIDEAFARFGRIDVLVNNAGIIGVGPAEAQTIEDFRQAMDTNFHATLHTTWHALPRLRQQEPLAGWPRRAAIVNIASIGGKIPVPHLLPYTASKFAIVGFSEALHAELRKAKILVSTICPGLMRTGGEDHAHFIGNAEAEARWFKFSAKTPGISTTPEHAADRIYSAVSHGSAEIVITPQAWLAARFHGVFPSSTQLIAGIVNSWILPDAP